MSQIAHAAWHNTSGKITHMNFYANTDTILIRLEGPGTDVPQCSNKDYFAIDGSMPESRRNQILSALLSAKAAGILVTLAYDANGTCVPYGNNPNAYRSILRVVR